MRKLRLILLVAVSGTIAVTAIGVFVHYKRNYPYGSSHCCIIGMMGALEQYALDHGGIYPKGEITPEASLSLLCRSNYLDAYTIRGMTVPEKQVRRILERGELLGPNDCGWHYVEGLTQADDPRLALLYCKEALGHNGNRTEDGGRQVVLVSGIEWISGDKWPAFLQQQKELLQARGERAKAGAPMAIGIIELPDGARITHVDGSISLKEESLRPDGSSHGVSSGTFSRSELIWYQAPIRDGSLTRTLSFSNLVSDPVTINFTNGMPDVTNYIFKMKRETPN